MSTLTRKDVTALFGDLDDVVIAKIIATGATCDELAEAHAWIANDEPLMNAGRPLPSGRVARLVDLFAVIKGRGRTGRRRETRLSRPVSLPLPR
jgi:hypothetical protein